MRLAAVLSVVACVATAASCAKKQVDQANKPDPAFHDTLIARLARDQAVRDTFVAELKAAGELSTKTVLSMRAVDSANTAWLKPLMMSTGFPTKAQVGVDGVEAAFLLIQHADADPLFQATMLPQLEVAYKRGEVTGESLAMLTDRVYKAQGRPQRYGTQTTGKDGHPVVDPIEDSAHVDARRRDMGMMPLSEYMQKLDSVFARTPK
jgi:hypothetical protein